MMSNCPQCGAAIRFEGLCLKCRKENEEKAVLEMSAEELESFSDDYDGDRCRLPIPKSSLGRFGRTGSAFITMSKCPQCGAAIMRKRRFSG
ncbi:MAG: hypothetical protein NC299_02480 [Lachnospiraceae bacterium]|nr:hypothetical protein [Ruminococcus sp.]MCM1274216.1 hypothetical protein [Lachnospiraceae bacterium]